MIADDTHRLALLQVIFDEIPDIIILKDENGDFVLGNAALARLYNVHTGALPGKSDVDFGVDPVMAEAFRANVLAVMAGGKTEIVFERSRDALTGEIRHYKSIKKPLLTPEGKQQLLIIAHDITDIVRAQEKLAEHDQRLREVMAATFEGIWDWNIASGRVIHNEQWYALIGYAEGEIADRVEAFAACIHPDDKGRVWEAIQALLDGRTEAYRSEHRMICKDGSVIWVMDRGRVAERDDDGKPLRVVGAFADITARKNDQQALERALADANQATRAKSEFLATMSHEIRTPMNGILGMAQLLMLDEVSPEERREWASTILNSGQTLLTLLNDILDFSKVEAGRLELMPAPFSPCQMARETLAIFDEQALAKGIRIILDCSLESRQYVGDALRLRQMLSNYVSNAIKFTDQGEILIQVSEVAPGVLEFSVKDSGIGISAEKQGLLFTPFTQIDGSSTRRFGGTGLGLSIVRQLALLMGGSIGLESHASNGSRFWFRVVLKALAETPSVESSSTAGPEESRFLSGKLLVAEDNPINRKVISGLLGKLGLELKTVEDGQQALHILGSEVFDLVLMDIQMPNMDGISATHEIRARNIPGRQGHLPIVALTAGVFDEDRQRCLDAGMDDFISKPVDFKELKLTLSKWLQRDLP